jgi:hypothetical protein
VEFAIRIALTRLAASYNQLVIWPSGLVRVVIRPTGSWEYVKRPVGWFIDARWLALS